MALEERLRDLREQNVNLESKMNKLNGELIEKKNYVIEKLLEVPILEMQIKDVYIQICKKLGFKSDVRRKKSCTVQILFLSFNFRFNQAWSN